MAIVYLKFEVELHGLHITSQAQLQDVMERLRRVLWYEVHDGPSQESDVAFEIVEQAGGVES